MRRVGRVQSRRCCHLHRGDGVVVGAKWDQGHVGETTCRLHVAVLATLPGYPDGRHEFMRVIRPGATKSFLEHRGAPII